MRYRRVLLSLAVLAAAVAPAPAGVIFNRKPRPSPSARVPALLATVKGDRDAAKREAAAEELRECNPALFPEIVPTLIGVAQQDPSAGVRLEALRTLGHYRPVSQQAGWALEQAMEKDASLRVRMQLRPVVWQYRLSGYRGPGKDELPLPPPGVKTEEPPLADPPPAEAPAPAAGNCWRWPWRRGTRRPRDRGCG